MLKIKEIRNQKPVILNISNMVTPQNVANAISFYWGSPIMFTDSEEARELTEISSAVVINLGSTNQESIKNAIICGKKANATQTPIIVDPVAIGATKLRRDNFAKIAEQVHFSVIRGNTSEISYLAKSAWNGNGIDAVESKNDIQNAITTAKKYRTWVVLSGQEDIVTDGKQTFLVKNGHPYFQTNVGSGDMLDGILGTAVAIDNTLLSVTLATVTLSICGEIAGKKFPNQPASFFTEVFNQLGTITDQTISQLSKITKLKEDNDND